MYLGRSWPGLADRSVGRAACKQKGGGCARGSAHLWDEELVGSKIPAGGGRAERAEVPTLLIGPQYGQGKPGHKGRAKARQVRPCASPDQATAHIL